VLFISSKGKSNVWKSFVLAKVNENDVYYIYIVIQNKKAGNCYWDGMGMGTKGHGMVRDGEDFCNTSENGLGMGSMCIGIVGDGDRMSTPCRSNVLGMKLNCIHIFVVTGSFLY